MKNIIFLLNVHTDANQYKIVEQLVRNLDPKNWQFGIEESASVTDTIARLNGIKERDNSSYKNALLKLDIITDKHSEGLSLCDLAMLENEDSQDISYQCFKKHPIFKVHKEKFQEKVSLMRPGLIKLKICELLCEKKFDVSPIEKQELEDEAVQASVKKDEKAFEVANEKRNNFILEKLIKLAQQKNLIVLIGAAHGFAIKEIMQKIGPINELTVSFYTINPTGSENSCFGDIQSIFDANRMAIDGSKLNDFKLISNAEEIKLPSDKPAALSSSYGVGQNPYASFSSPPANELERVSDPKSPSYRSTPT